jgi:hypothetical protein
MPDAEATVTRPNMKTAEQQAVLALHRSRQSFISNQGVIGRIWHCRPIQQLYLSFADNPLLGSTSALQCKQVLWGGAPVACIFITSASMCNR